MIQKVDSRNKNIKVYVNGKITDRNNAKVSVFDSVVQGGDAVWEGLRVYNSKIFCLDKHLQRLQDSAKAMDFKDIPSNDFIIAAIKQTLAANNMTDGVHIRLTLSRGEKITSGMNPRLNQFGCTLIILPEWKQPIYPEAGIVLITSSVRRNTAQCLDSKIHHNNIINNILAKIEANYAGADDAIMLDLNGFVSETNATNIFMVKKKILYTSHADSCLPGITRGVVLEIAEELAIPTVVKNLSLTEFYSADEVFTTGTMGELSKVLSIDGRIIGNNRGNNDNENNTLMNSIMTTINKRFKERTKLEGIEIL